MEIAVLHVALEKEESQVVSLVVYKGMARGDLLKMLHSAYPHLESSAVLGLRGPNGLYSIEDILNNPLPFDGMGLSIVMREPSNLLKDYDPSESNVILLESDRELYDSILSTDQTLLIVLFGRSSEQSSILPFFHHFSTKYPQHIFAFADVDASSEFCSGLCVSLVPSIQFFVCHHRVASLDLPEPEHLNALLQLPFLEHMSVHREIALQEQMMWPQVVKKADDTESAQILLQFVQALEESENPVLHPEEASILRFLVYEQKSSLMKSFKEYKIDQNLSKFIRSCIKEAEEFSETSQHLYDLAEFLYSEKEIDDTEYEEFLKLTRSGNEQLRMMLSSYQRDNDLKRLLNAVRQTLKRGKIIEDSKRDALLQQQLNVIVDIEQKGFIDSASGFLITKLFLTENVPAIEAFKRYQLDRDERRLVDVLLDGLKESGVYDSSSDDGDDESADEEDSISVLQGHPLEHIVEALDKRILREDLDQVKHMVMCNDPLIMGVFDVYSSKGDFDDLIETLQCLLRLNYGIESLQENAKIDPEVFQKKKTLVTAAYSLYLEDLNEEEFNDTMHRTLQVVNATS